MIILPLMERLGNGDAALFLVMRPRNDYRAVDAPGHFCLRGGIDDATF
jgi:hypothetical protein